MLNKNENMKGNRVIVLIRNKVFSRLTVPAYNY